MFAQPKGYIMKPLGIVFLAFLVIACGHYLNTTKFDYMPSPARVENPIQTIKNTIESQPTAYAYMPVGVEVDDRCIALYMQQSRPAVMPIIGGRGTVIGPGASYIDKEMVCYKNVGRVDLFRLDEKNVWRIEINDRNGEYMYWVFTYDREDAEHFMDALAQMIGSTEPFITKRRGNS
jgi:hypothetical protein